MPVMQITPAVSSNTSSIAFGSTKKYKGRYVPSESGKILKDTKYAKSPIRNFIKYAGAACAAAVTMLFTGCSKGNDIIPTPTNSVTPIKQEVGSVSTVFALDSTDMAKVDTFSVHSDFNGEDSGYRVLDSSTSDTLKLRYTDYAYGNPQGYGYQNIYKDGTTGKITSSATASKNVKFNDIQQTAPEITTLEKNAKGEVIVAEKGVGFVKYVKSGVDEALRYDLTSAGVAKKIKATFKHFK